MDIAKFFEPVQKFATYLVDRATLLLVTVLLAGMIARVPTEFYESHERHYRHVSDFLDGIGLSKDARAFLVLVLLLITLIAALELHEKILRLLDRLAPVQFMDRLYYGESVYERYLPLMWRGYCKKLDLIELQSLYQITSYKIGSEMAPKVHRTEVFDFAPGWFTLMALIYIFAPRPWLTVSVINLISLLVLIMLVGYLWQLYSGATALAENVRREYLSVAAMLANKIHEFEPLDEEQTKRLRELRGGPSRQRRPWRTVKLYSPWVGVAAGVWEYLRAELESAERRAEYEVGFKVPVRLRLVRLVAGRQRTAPGPAGRR